MKNLELYQQAEQMLLEYQSLHGLRTTPERRLILRKITEHAGGFSPADVQEWVKEDFISSGTVYNTLNLLEKAHILHCLRKQYSSRTMLYELTLGEQNSMQVVCARCGRVTRVRDKSVETALHMKNYPNFVMRHYSVYVFGECKHCRAAKA